jgi:ubiquinone/menaquinone biosynthesis C-methylase UbiE
MPYSVDDRILAEKEWHDAEDIKRNNSKLITGVYGSDIFQETESHFLNALGNVKGMRILDFGCGTATTSYQLEARQARVTGIDLSLPRILEGKRWYGRPDNEGAPDFSIAAGEFLPFAEGTFDAVFGKQILHHVVLETALPEIVRVLKNSGQAVFLEPLRHNPILEGYRRLTPQLRSPTERALTCADIRKIGSYFHECYHQEFILFSVLPVLLEILFRKKVSLKIFLDRLQKIDQLLVQKLPAIGKFYWQTVIVLKK